MKREIPVGAEGCRRPLILSARIYRPSVLLVILKKLEQIIMIIVYNRGGTFERQYTHTQEELWDQVLTRT